MELEGHHRLRYIPPVFAMWLGTPVGAHTVVSRFRGAIHRGGATPDLLRLGFVVPLRVDDLTAIRSTAGTELSIDGYLHGCASHAIKTSVAAVDRHNILQAVQRLSDVLGTPINAADVNYELRLGSRHVDAVVDSGSHLFAIEWKASGSLGHIFRAVHQFHSMAGDLPKSTIPLLVVPFMGESARAYCDEVGVAWLDLSGNAKIVAPGLYVHTLGHDNRFRRPGRPESAFGPKGSRVARWMLMNQDRAIRQRALAAATGLDEGYVSRVVGRLIEMGLLERHDSGVRATDASGLLEAWRDEYRFDKHSVTQGHIAVAAGESVVQRVTRTLEQSDMGYAVTGLAGAWYWTKFARYRLSTLYLKDSPSSDLLEVLEFREDPRGANTWLVVPQDESVFDGFSNLEGVRCVHPVQVYLDLKSHPERAAEAAEEIRDRLILTSSNDR